MTQQSPRLFNRELSWLEFNQRVLDEARDDQIPLLERLKFIAITGSNLDEFFMVRVGGLRVLVTRGITSLDPSGMTPLAQLDSISVRAHQMMADQYECFLRELEPQLAAAGLRRVPGNELSVKPSSRSSGIRLKKTAISGAWKDENTFELTLRYIESPHHDLLTFNFSGDQLELTFNNSRTRLSANNKDVRPTLKGRAGSI